MSDRHFFDTKAKVHTRGIPPDGFLNELIDVVKTLPDDIFAPRKTNEPEIYDRLLPILGPWTSPLHRRAAMCEALRVLGGFESSWRWTTGADITNPTENHPERNSAGIFQISYNSRAFGQDLRDLIKRDEIDNGVEFQNHMKASHAFAIEYCARLLRYTVRHHGPIRDHHIDKWLKRDAVNEFQGFLA